MNVMLTDSFKFYIVFKVLWERDTEVVLLANRTIVKLTQRNTLQPDVMDMHMCK